MAISKDPRKKAHTFMIDDKLNYQARIRAAEMEISKSKLFRTAIRDYIENTNEIVATKNVNV